MVATDSRSGFMLEFIATKKPSEVAQRSENSVAGLSPPQRAGVWFRAWSMTAAWPGIYLLSSVLGEGDREAPD
jgi:hypothetical protein